ncbi:MAG TPA: 5-oxoprolinase subunit PxpB [Chitinophagaceae bacterium]|nr:5-oxoprolinase subunit PxpB [Chitinophagaceae bacterium]
MNHLVFPYRIFPLGDAAITIDFGNCINESVNNEVISRFSQMQKEPILGMIEAVPAYSSLTIYYDVLMLRKKISATLTVYDWMKEQIENRLHQQTEQAEEKRRIMRIPVCYDDEFAMDINQLAAARNISREEVVQIHTSKTYKVYMLGFLPGFAYMGELDEKIAMPRKSQPVKITAGSVGIAGKQTGIYPLASPGGWQIIGRTPLKLFDGNSNKPTLLKEGDSIQLYSISRDEFKNY